MSLVVAVVNRAMVHPMMIAIDLWSLKNVGKRPKGPIITLVVNGLVKPFTMAALAVLVFNHVFTGLIDPDKALEYIAGLILPGAALAMVVGVPVEVPVMLSRLSICNRTCSRFPA